MRRLEFAFGPDRQSITVGLGRANVLLPIPRDRTRSSLLFTPLNSMVVRVLVAIMFVASVSATFGEAAAGRAGQIASQLQHPHWTWASTRISWNRAGPATADFGVSCWRQTLHGCWQTKSPLPMQPPAIEAPRGAGDYGRFEPRRLRARRLCITFSGRSMLG